MGTPEPAPAPPPPAFDEAMASASAAWLAENPTGLLLGLMGLQDVFFKMGLPFDSPAARDVSRRISEEIYFNALWASTELAEANGPHAAFAEIKIKPRFSLIDQHASQAIQHLKDVKIELN